MSQIMETFGDKILPEILLIYFVIILLSYIVITIIYDDYSFTA